MTKEIEAVAAVIEQDGKFLITKRLKESHLGHCWEFPGGKRENGETVEECAVRECQEEIGVVIEPVRYLKAVRYEYPDVKVFLHFVLCRLVSGDPQPIECADPTWIRPEEFAKYEFPAADRQVIEELIIRMGGEGRAPGRAERVSTAGRNPRQDPSEGTGG